MKKIQILFRYFFIGLFPIFLLVSCDNTQAVDLSKIPPRKNFPDRNIIKADIIFKDSGKITAKLKAPLIEEYSLIDSPYIIFRKGIRLQFWEKNAKKPGYFIADWAKSSDASGWYHGKGHVVIVNEKGDSLKSNQILWDKKNKKIFSRDTVYLISALGDSLQSNNGIEASDDLSTYTMYNNQGVKLFDDKKQ